MVVQHPMALKPTTSKPVEYALKYAEEDLNDTRSKRLSMVVALRKLAEACSKENEELTLMCEESVAVTLKAIGTKNVALMREIS